MHQNRHAAASFITRMNVIYNENCQIVMCAKKIIINWWKCVLPRGIEQLNTDTVNNLASGEEQNDLRESGMSFSETAHIFSSCYTWPSRFIFEQNDHQNVPGNVPKWIVKIILHVSHFWLIWFMMYDAQAMSYKTRFY